MSRRPPRRRGRSGVSRRGLLVAASTGLAGVGIGLNVVSSSAYTNGSAERASVANVAGDTDGALLELLVADSVKKNTQSLLVEITNNAGQQLALDVSLDDPTQGTLTGPNGSGDTVSLTLSAGGTGSVDLASGEPDGTDVGFAIRHSSADFSFDIGRSTTVQSGNTAGEVTIDKLKQFKADQAANEWTIKELQASSTNYDLDTVELTVAEQGTGDVVATREFTNVGSTSFTRSGTGKNPGITLQPDTASYDVRKNITYVLTVTATDTDGNFDRETVTS